MRFLVDNQLPPSLARWLRDRGHDAEHVFESGLHLLDDRALWARALASGRIVVSKDEDFLYLTNQPGDAGRFLWVRLGNCRSGSSSPSRASGGACARPATAGTWHRLPRISSTTSSRPCPCGSG